jgi:hypothetical protein
MIINNATSTKGAAFFDFRKVADREYRVIARLNYSSNIRKKSLLSGKINENATTPDISRSC